MAWCLSTIGFFARLAWGEEIEIVYPAEKGQLDHEYEQEIEREHVHDSEPKETYTRFEKDIDPRLLIPKTKPEPCDQEMWIYTLTHYTERNISNSGYNKTMTNCSRPFIVQRVSGSNMILLVINNLCRADFDQEIPWPEPLEVDYNMSLACYRVLFNDFPRRHYMSCINRHVNESEIKICGNGYMAGLSRYLLIIALSLRLLY